MYGIPMSDINGDDYLCMFRLGVNQLIYLLTQL